MTWMGDRVKEAKALASWAMGRAVTLAIAAGLLLIVLAELHWLGPWYENPITLLTIVGGMIFFLRHEVAEAHEGLLKKVSERLDEMQNAAARIEQIQASIETDVGRHSANVELMQETLRSAGELRTLETAMMDLAPRFEAVKEGEDVVIDHLGLDMTAAWDRLCPVIEKLVGKKSAKITFRLLILGKKAAGGLGHGNGLKVPLPQGVQKWLSHGDGKRPTIEQALLEIRKTAERTGRGALHYEIRSYRDLPLVHGIRIRGKLDAAYVAICRWDDNRREDDKFWWAGHEYHRVLGPASDEELDLMAILEGYFDRWWDMNDPARGAPAAAA